MQDWYIRFIVIFGFLCFTSYVFAQEEMELEKIKMDSLRQKLPNKNTTIFKTNPFNFLWGNVPITSEIMVMTELVDAPQQSTLIGLSYMGKEIFWYLIDMADTTNFNFEVQGYRFQFGHRWYLNRGGKNASRYAPEGQYLMPHISYGSVKYTYRPLASYDYFIRADQFNINLVYGYQDVFNNSVVYDLYFGVGYKRNSILEKLPSGAGRFINPDDLPWPYRTPIKVLFGVYIGFSTD